MDTEGTTDVATIEQFTDQLRRWYETDYKGFRTLFDEAVANVKPIPAGQDPEVVHDWRGCGIEELCAFFVDWYNWMPRVGTGLRYIQRFSWLYYENEYGLVFVSSGPGYMMTADFVTLRGHLMDSSETLPLVREWVEALGSQMDQFVVPEGGFKSFNELFVREVKPGARPISDPDDDTVVVAPADCVINMIVDELTETTPIPVKSVTMNVVELLGGSRYARLFVGGTAVSCILMPDSYHRFHSPVAGRVVESREHVAGEYFGIKDFPDLLNKGDVGYGYDYCVFERFRRGYLVIETACHGLVAMVPVGLNTIGSVVFEPRFARVDEGSLPINKGEEVGYFQYGGSLNILLFEPGRFPALQLLQGQRIGVLTPTS